MYRNSALLVYRRSSTYVLGQPKAPPPKIIVKRVSPARDSSCQNAGIANRLAKKRGASGPRRGNNLVRSGLFWSNERPFEPKLIQIEYHTCLFLDWQILNVAIQILANSRISRFRFWSLFDRSIWQRCRLSRSFSSSQMQLETFAKRNYRILWLWCTNLEDLATNHYT